MFIYPSEPDFYLAGNQNSGNNIQSIFVSFFNKYVKLFDDSLGKADSYYSQRIQVLEIIFSFLCAEINQGWYTQQRATTPDLATAINMEDIGHENLF